MHHNGKVRQPAAIQLAVDAFIQLGEKHGLEAVHEVYAQAVSCLKAEEARRDWVTRITGAQSEFALIETR